MKTVFNSFRENRAVTPKEIFPLPPTSAAKDRKIENHRPITVMGMSYPPSGSQTAFRRVSQVLRVKLFCGSLPHTLREFIHASGVTPHTVLSTFSRMACTLHNTTDVVAREINCTYTLVYILLFILVVSYLSLDVNGNNLCWVSHSLFLFSLLSRLIYSGRIDSEVRHPNPSLAWRSRMAQVHFELLKRMTYVATADSDNDSLPSLIACDSEDELDYTLANFFAISTPFEEFMAWIRDRCSGLLDNLTDAALSYIEEIYFHFATFQPESITQMILSYMRLFKAGRRFFEGKDESIIQHHMRIVEQYLKKNIFVATAGGPSIDFREKYKSFKEFTRIPLFNNLVTCMGYIITSSVGAGIRFKLRDNGLDDVCSYMREKARGGNIFSMTELFLDSLLMFLDNLPSYVDTGDIRSFDRYNFGVYFESVERLERTFPLRTYGFRSGEQICAVQYNIDLEQALELGSRLLINCASSRERSHLLSHVRSEHSKLKVLRTKVQSLGENSKDRDLPFSILVFGEPKTGKSRVVNEIIGIYGNFHGLPDLPECHYTRNLTEEYWSGYSNSCWSCVLDDIAATNKDSKQPDTSVGQLINIVNTLAYPLNMAAVEDKGKVFFNSPLVVGTTNKKDFDARAYCTTPAAAWRRMPYVITMDVKDAFCVKDENGRIISRTLDLDAIAEYKKSRGIKFVEVNNFKLEQFIPNLSTGNKTPDYKLLGTYDSLAELSVKIVELIAKHKDEVESTRERNLVLNSDHFCKHFVRQRDCHRCYTFDRLLTDKDFDHSAPVIAMATVTEVVTISFFTFLLLQLHTYCNSWYIYRWLCRKVFAVFMNRVYYYTADLRVRVLDRLGVAPVPITSSRESLKRRIDAIIYPEFNITHMHKCAGITILLSGLLVYAKMQGQNKFEATSNQKTEKESKKKDDNVYKYPTTYYPLERHHPGRTADVQRVANTTVSSTIWVSICGPSSEGLAVMATCLRSNIYITVAHAFPDSKVFEVSYSEVGPDKMDKCINLTSDTIFLDRDMDIAIFQILPLRPRPNLVKYLSNTMTEQMCKVYWCHPDSDLKLAPSQRGKEGYDRNGTWGKTDGYISSTPSQRGYCGSLFIHVLPRGFTIASMVCAGRIGFKSTVSVPILRSYVDNAILELQRKGLVVATACPGSINLGSYEVTQPLHYKSRFNYRDTSLVRVFGTSDIPRSKPRGATTKTIIHNEVVKKYGFLDYGDPPLTFGYKDGTWKDYFAYALDRKCSPAPTFAEHTIVPAFDNYCERIENIDLSDVSKVDLYVAINGLPGVKFIDSVNFNSSMGLPYSKPKREFHEPDVRPGYPDGKCLNPTIQADYDRALDIYKQGSMNHFIFSASPKVEVTPRKNIEKGKTRMFMVGSYIHILITRVYTIRIVKTIQDNPFLFECAVGVNAHSTNWSTFVGYFEHHDTMINGDFSGYDLNMPNEVLFYSFQVIVAIAERAGYSEEDICVLNNVFADIIYHLVNVDGDLVQFMKGHASGHALTVIINSIANSILMRIMYQFIMKDLCSFNSLVKLMTFGDDNISGVSPLIPEFNQVAITEAFAFFDIVYTMADKEREVVPYIPLSECDFLKRRWVFDTTYRVYRAPLQIESIIKSLLYRVDSKSCSDIQHTRDVLRSAQLEFVQYGRKTYDSYMIFCKHVVELHHINGLSEQVPFYSYDQLMGRLYPGLSDRK